MQMSMFMYILGTCVCTSHVNVHVHLNVHEYVYLHVYVHVHVHVHIYIHVHVHVHVPFLFDALTKCPPTKRLVNISPQTKHPWTFHLEWHFVPVTFWPSWDGLYVHSSHHHFCLENGMLSHNVTLHLFFIKASPNLVTFCLYDTVSPPYDSSIEVWHDVHPVTCCPSCDTMSSLWHFFLALTLYLFWYNLSTLSLLPILLHFHLCNTLTILWYFVYFWQLHHNWPIYPENLTGHHWE
jgi:hypothetical protein